MGMKRLIMVFCSLLLMSGVGYAECFKGEVVAVKSPTVLSVKCMNTGDVKDVPLYGITATPGMELKAVEFLNREILGQQVNCFRHTDSQYYVTYAGGGSIQNRYLLTGCANIDQVNCSMFICKDMEKFQALGNLARTYR
jgi:hypothetical protein